MQVLGTFQSRDAAEAVKEAFEKEGFAPHSLIIMSNSEEATPPEAAHLEVGDKGDAGMAGIEEKLGKAVMGLMGKKNTLDGDGFEGEAKGGALLGITVTDATGVERAKALLERHFAGDIEVAQAD